MSAFKSSVETSLKLRAHLVCFAFCMVLMQSFGQVLTEQDRQYVQSLLDSSEYLKLKDPPRSLSLALQALDWLPEKGYESMRVFAYLRAANSEKIAAHKVKSLEYVNQATALSSAIRDSSLMMRSAFMKATIFGFYDDADSALVYYQQAIDMYRSGDEVFYAANGYTNIAGLFRNMGDETKAEAYYLKGYEISRGDNYAWIFTLSRLISFYASKNNPKYIAYLDTFSTSDFARTAPKATVAAHFYTFLNITDASVAEKEKKLREVYTFAKKQSSATHQVEFGIKLNDLLVEQKKYAESRQLLSELITISRTAGNGKMEAAVNRALYENAKALNDPMRALTYIERFSAINDSLHVEEMQTQIQELNVRFEVEQKDHEIERQNLSLEQARKNRNFLILIIGLLGIMAGLTILYFRNRIRTARRLRAQEEIIHQRDKEKLLHEKELVQLTASLETQELERTRIARDLHDGIGSLMSGISAQVENLLSKDPDNQHYTAIKSMVKETATELRRTSYELMPATLLRMGLDPAIRDLCFNILAKNGIEPTLELEPDTSELTQEQQLVIYRILQELLHNIVKHAGATTVLIQLMRYDHDMTLIVEDNGKGFSVTESSLSGIGLGSIRSRVNLLGGMLDIASVPGDGTTVTINFATSK